MYKNKFTWWKYYSIEIFPRRVATYIDFFCRGYTMWCHSQFNFNIVFILCKILYGLCVKNIQWDVADFRLWTLSNITYTTVRKLRTIFTAICSGTELLTRRSAGGELWCGHRFVSLADPYVPTVPRWYQDQPRDLSGALRTYAGVYAGRVQGIRQQQGPLLQCVLCCPDVATCQKYGPFSLCRVRQGPPWKWGAEDTSGKGSILKCWRLYSTSPFQNWYFPTGAPKVQICAYLRICKPSASAARQYQ